jgi:group II intron reverse transcriptase/maturase
MNGNRYPIGKDVPINGNTPRNGSTRSEPMDIQQVLEKRNMHTALKSVLHNNGAAGIDGMPAAKLLFYLSKHWCDDKIKLLNGNHLPKPVLGVGIDKGSGKGKRLLGIPTVRDRLIQQAIHQVLSKTWDKEFSAYSYGFRPRRNAGQAVLQAQSYINSGLGHIVNIDLKSFFDMVNHDYLMNLVKRKVKDPILLRLIWRYLRSPIEIDGKLHKRRQGVPQGGPLSPLLSNIVLNELDRELESRNYMFVRYADDFCVFTKSKSNAQRAMIAITKFIESNLHLVVNKEKSHVCRPSQLVFLGYTFTSVYTKGAKGQFQLIVANDKLHKFQRELKRLTRKTTPMTFNERIMRINWLVRGWLNYFKHANLHAKLVHLDHWLRCRLRYCIWHHWKKREKKRRSLIRLGVPMDQAYAWSRTSLGGWRVACSPILGTTITIARLKQRGYISLVDYYNDIH